jgi:hypothetical protein
MKVSFSWFLGRSRQDRGSIVYHAGGRKIGRITMMLEEERRWMQDAW